MTSETPYEEIPNSSEDTPTVPFRYRLKSLTFKNGSVLELDNLTVIVGANNAGKSRILKDVSSLIGSKPPRTVLVESVDAAYPNNFAEFQTAYGVRLIGQPLDRQLTGLSHDLCTPFDRNLNASVKIDELVLPRNFHAAFGELLAVFLATDVRLSLVSYFAESPMHQNQRVSRLMKLLYEARPTVEAELRETIKNAGFKLEINLDRTTFNRVGFRVRNLSDSPSTKLPEGRDEFDQLASLDEQGDGIRSFVALVAAIVTIVRPVWLIDEPEAFLHPPQAIRIGEFIASKASPNRQIIVATHSADVLRGILGVSPKASIVRVTRDENQSGVTRLDPNVLKELLENPVLGSARVLDGLFYSGVIVTEADADCRFYNCALQKLRRQDHLHFVNANGKGGVFGITSLYKKVGVRCLAIVDFDVLNDVESLRAQLEAVQMPESHLSRVLELRTVIGKGVGEVAVSKRFEMAFATLGPLIEKMRLCIGDRVENDKEIEEEKSRLVDQLNRRCAELKKEAKPWQALKENGRSGLAPDSQVAFDELNSTCRSYGLFINPYGELESTMVDCGLRHSHDREWFTNAMKNLSVQSVDDSRAPWEFIKAIDKYFAT